MGKNVQETPQVISKCYEHTGSKINPDKAYVMSYSLNNNIVNVTYWTPSEMDRQLIVRTG